jgi:hypothetical protein
MEEIKEKFQRSMILDDKNEYKKAFLEYNKSLELITTEILKSVKEKEQEGETKLKEMKKIKSLICFQKLSLERIEKLYVKIIQQEAEEEEEKEEEDEKYIKNKEIKNQPLENKIPHKKNSLEEKELSNMSSKECKKINLLIKYSKKTLF